MPTFQLQPNDQELSALPASACLPAYRLESDATTEMQILHTNDHHGRIQCNGDGEYGIAARKTAVDSICAKLLRS